MINSKVFNQLKNNPRSSFAKWKVNPNNPKDVSDLSVFNNVNLNELKPHIIFVAMNMADNSNIGKLFSNFHSGVIRHNDYRLAEAICESSLKGKYEGAYMYDLFMEPTPSSRAIEVLYKANKAYRDKCISDFINHCRYINQPSTPGTYSSEELKFKTQEHKKYIICIGKGYHYKALRNYFKNSKTDLIDFELCEPIQHHSGLNHRYNPKNQVDMLKDIADNYGL